MAHFDPKRDNYITTDACNTGLGATLWQKEGVVFRPVAFASRFLTDCEKQYAINELELLGALWGLEHFKYYVYGKRVNLLTDHQALQPLLKKNRAHKQYSARLTRWLDRLSHFDVNIQYTAGKNIPLTDYLSRHPIVPTEIAELENKADGQDEAEADEEFVINQIYGLRSVSPPTWRKWAAHSMSCASRNTQGRRKKNFQGAVRIHEATSRKPTEWQWSSQPKHLFNKLDGEGPLGPVSASARHTGTIIARKLETVKPEISPNLSSPSHAHNAGKRAELPLDWVSTRKEYITRKNLSSFPAQAALEFLRRKTHGQTTRSHVTGNIHRRHTEPVHHATSHCHGKTSRDTEKDANQHNPP